MIYFLDTNICAFILNGTHPKLNQRYIQHNKNEIKIPSVVLSELLYGAEKSKRREQNLANIRLFTSEIEVIPFDVHSAGIAGSIRSDLEKIGQMIGSYDLLIAATALAYGGVVVTNNTKEFGRIKNLIVEDWSC